MTKNLINEVPEYGPVCEEVAALAPHKNHLQINIASLNQNLEALTEAIVWVMFILIVIIFVVQIFDCWVTRDNKIAAKRAELVRAIQ